MPSGHKIIERGPGRHLTGVAYTKRWVVKLLLDLAGYRAESNLVDVLAVEPAAVDGAARLQSTPMQVALAWLLQRSPHMLLIPGSSSVGHIQLPADLITELDSISSSR